MESLRELNMPDHALLDAIRDEFELKNDAALSKLLGIQPPVISKIRHGKVLISPGHILRIYDATKWSIDKIRGYLG